MYCAYQRLCRTASALRDGVQLAQTQSPVIDVVIFLGKRFERDCGMRGTQAQFADPVLDLPPHFLLNEGQRAGLARPA